MVWTFQAGDPEQGWPPFMDWLRQQGLDPNDVRAVTVDVDAMSMVVTRFRYRDGKHYVINDEVVTYQETRSITSVPPRYRDEVL